MEAEIVTLSIKLPKDFHRKVKLYAVKRGVTIKEIFMRHMEKLLAQEEESERSK